MGELYQQAVRLTNPACVCTYAADLVYNPSELMNKKMPLKQPGWNFRGRTFALLICGLLLLASCNFPIRDFSALPRPYATLDPAIFEYHRSATPAAEQPGAAPISTPQPPPVVDEALYHIYAIRSGDTFETVARHFGVAPAAIISMEALPQTGILPPGRYLVIPKNTDNLFEQEMILPDSAVINSPCAESFDISAYVSAAGGYLSTFSQSVAGIRSSGAEIVRRVADNQSVNPMLLLAILEHRAGLVFGKQPPADIDHPLSFHNMYYKGLYQELSLAARMVNTGYYGWRYGTVTMVTFTDQVSQRISPQLNAGSAALMYLFSQLYPSTVWNERLLGKGGFMETYLAMFPDPWLCATEVEPLLSDTLSAPQLELPFAPGEEWAFTAGPHYSWVEGTPLGALDFAPNIKSAGCRVSPLWVRASAPGVITRADNGVVMLTLEDEMGDFTGWEVMYLHIAANERVPLGTRLRKDDPIGHPSCEGGSSTGTHVHIARKYKGEWIGAQGLFPFVLSGWVAYPGERVYQGRLIKDGQVIFARQGGNQDSLIKR
jgi:LysM repeat protein